MALNVIVADDHPVARIGIRTMLGMQRQVQCEVTEADGVDALYRLLALQPVDVLVTDLSMPGGQHPDGVAMLRQLRLRYPYLPIVLLTSSRNLGLLRCCADWAVQCVLSKQDNLEQLSAALYCALAGQAFLGNELRSRLQAIDPGATWPWPVVPLSPCERDVIRAWGQGTVLTKIAARRRRSLNTISRQKVVAMQKLFVDSDMDLMELLRNGLVAGCAGQLPGRQARACAGVHCAPGISTSIDIL